jgi:hypothetical protein
MGQHALQLPRADHARLVDDKHIAGVSMSRPCSQPCSMLAMVRDAMPDPLSRFGGDAGQGHAAHLVARRLPASRATPSMALFPVPA